MLKRSHGQIASLTSDSRDSNDEELLREVQRFHSEVSRRKRATPRVLEEWRIFILRNKARLGALARSVKDVIDARHFDISQKDWEDVFRLAQDTKAKPSDDSQRKLRAITSIGALWGMEIVTYYSLSSQPVRNLELLRKCAVNDPDFKEFPRFANIVMLRRHEAAMYNNGIVCVEKCPFPLRLDDLVTITQLSSGKAVVNDKHGRQLTPESIHDHEEMERVDAWANCEDGEIQIRDQLLRTLREGHHDKYLLQKDTHGMLSSRPAKKLPSHPNTRLTIPAAERPNFPGLKTNTIGVHEEDVPTKKAKTTERPSRLSAGPQSDDLPGNPTTTEGALVSSTSSANASEIPPQRPQTAPSSHDQVSETSAGELSLGQAGFSMHLTPAEQHGDPIAQKDGPPDSVGVTRPTHDHPSVTIPEPVLPAGCDAEWASRMKHWNIRIHETERQAPHPNLSKWVYPVRFAKENKSEELAEDASCCDVNRLSWETFRRLSIEGHIFQTPLIINESFPDVQDHSVDSYINSLERAFASTTIDVRYHGSEPKAVSTSEVVNLLRSSADHVLPSAPNLLDLCNLSHAIAPGLTRLPRFRLLDYLNHAARAKYMKRSGKQSYLTAFDLGASQAFDIFGLSGAFSGAHLDFLGGTWLRNLFGVKVWMIVPQRLMSEECWSTFGRDGDSWDPKEKSRAIILQPGDVLFMPPGIPVIHAVHTLDTCLMNGGMLWDDMTIAPTLRTLKWIGQHQRATNEAIPYQLDSILRELELVTRDSSRFGGESANVREAIEQLRDLACDCGACDEDCPCSLQHRRCTPMCAQHGIDARIPCLNEPTVGSDSTSPDGDDSGDYR